MAGFPAAPLQKDRKEWHEVSVHQPDATGHLMLYEFAKAFTDEDFAFSSPRTQVVWLDGFDAKETVFIRNCLHGKNCEHQLRFRPRIDGDAVVWVIESSKAHCHNEVSKSRFHDLAVKYGVEKGLTAEKAIIQLRRDFPDLVLPEGFDRTIENIRSNESTTGKTDGRIIGILEGFLRNPPPGLFVLTAIVSPVILIPFMCAGLDTVVADLIRNFTLPLHVVIDGTYNINRENLVLLGLGLCGLRMLASGIVNQVVPMFFCLARVEEYASWKALFEAAISHYSQHFGIDLRARVGYVFRDCTAGANRAVTECFGEDTDSFRDLEHVKRNISDWATRHSTNGLLDINLKESIIAKIAFSAGMLLYEFAGFWEAQFHRLELVGEVTFLNYLKNNIFIMEAGVLSAEWRCGPFASNPGFFVYLSNTLERQWRSLKHLLPNYRRQDVTTLMKEISVIFHANVVSGKYTGIVDNLDASPLQSMITGQGIWPTTEELGDPEVPRSRRLTACALLNAIDLHGMNSILLCRRFNPAFEWAPFGDGGGVFDVTAAFVVPIYSLSAVGSNQNLANQYLQVVLANTVDEARAAVVNDGVFNGKANSMMHRIFTVVLLISNLPITDVQRRFLMRSQSEAMFLIRHLELPGMAGTTNLRLTNGGPAPKAKQRAKARAQSKRSTRRRLGDAVMDPGALPEEIDPDEEDRNVEENEVEERGNEGIEQGPPVQHVHSWQAISFAMRKRCCYRKDCMVCLRPLRQQRAWICTAENCVEGLVVCTNCQEQDSRPAAGTAVRAAASNLVRFSSAEPTLAVDDDN